MDLITSLEENLAGISHHQHLAVYISAAFLFATDAAALPAAALPQWPCLQTHALRCHLWPWLLLWLLLLLVLEIMAGAGVLLAEGILPRAKPLCGAVEKLNAAGNSWNHSYSKVEAEEDCFLHGAGGEAVHCIGAGKAAAGKLGIHLEAIKVPLAHKKAHFCNYAEHHIYNVEPS